MIVVVGVVTRERNLPGRIFLFKHMSLCRFRELKIEQQLGVWAHPVPPSKPTNQPTNHVFFSLLSNVSSAQYYYIALPQS